MRPTASTSAAKPNTHHWSTRQRPRGDSVTRPTYRRIPSDRTRRWTLTSGRRRRQPAVPNLKLQSTAPSRRWLSMASMRRPRRTIVTSRRPWDELPCRVRHPSFVAGGRARGDLDLDRLLAFSAPSSAFPRCTTTSTLDTRPRQVLDKQVVDGPIPGVSLACSCMAVCRRARPLIEPTRSRGTAARLETTG